jgi:hypothetical protein
LRLKVAFTAEAVSRLLRLTAGSKLGGRCDLEALLVFVELLCGGWDFYKDVQRRLNRFTKKDKEIALTRLAGMLQNRGDQDATEADFRNALKASLAGLTDFWDDLLEEIVEDGLLVRAGNELTLSHQSFQEFLAARDLRDHMGNRPKQALGWYLTGNDWWKEVLAFYMTLSDRPADTDEWVVDRTLKSPNRFPT